MWFCCCVLSVVVLLFHPAVSCFSFFIISLWLLVLLPWFHCCVIVYCCFCCFSCFFGLFCSGFVVDLLLCRRWVLVCHFIVVVWLLLICCFCCCFAFLSLLLSCHCAVWLLWFGCCGLLHCATLMVSLWLFHCCGFVVVCCCCYCGLVVVVYFFHCFFVGLFLCDPFCVTLFVVLCHCLFCCCSVIVLVCCCCSIVVVFLYASFSRLLGCWIKGDDFFGKEMTFSARC